MSCLPPEGPQSYIVTADFNASYTTDFILADTSGGNFTIFLPDMEQYPGTGEIGDKILRHVFYIKKIDSSNTLTIRSIDSRVYIEGAPTATLSSNNSALVLKYAKCGTGFYIIGAYNGIPPS